MLAGGEGGRGPASIRVKYESFNGPDTSDVPEPSEEGRLFSVRVIPPVLSSTTLTVATCTVVVDSCVGGVPVRILVISPETPPFPMLLCSAAVGLVIVCTLDEAVKGAVWNDAPEDDMPLWPEKRFALRFGLSVRWLSGEVGDRIGEGESRRTSSGERIAALAIAVVVVVVLVVW
jgi:hypothetical protein